MPHTQAETDEQSRQEQCRIMYREHIGGALSLAKDVLRGCFLLNGAAVTAILASSKIDSLLIAAICFSFGAFSAIIASTCAYIYQFNIARTWKIFISNNDKDKFIYHEKDRKYAMIFSIASLSFFIIGVIISSIQLDIFNNTKATIELLQVYEL